MPAEQKGVDVRQCGREVADDQPRRTPVRRVVVGPGKDAREPVAGEITLPGGGFRVPSAVYSLVVAAVRDEESVGGRPDVEPVPVYPRLKHGHVGGVDRVRLQLPEVPDQAASKDRRNAPFPQIRVSIS